MNGWITPSLEYFECPTPVQTLCTEQLVNLLPRFIHFSAGVNVDDMLIEAGCIQVSPLADLVNFRGRGEALRAAWQKCLELTGDGRLAFEIVRGPYTPATSSSASFSSQASDGSPDLPSSRRSLARPS